MPTLLAIVPHPDDETYSFGGTIALAARAGWDCAVACISSGEAGERYDGGEPSPAALGPAREREFAESCRALGALPAATLRLPDGRLQSAPEPRAELDRLLAEVRPDMLLTLGADGAYGHPDHLAVHRWVNAAWGRAERAFPLLYAAFPPGLFLPQYELCVGMMGDPPAPAREDVGVAKAHYRADTSPARETKLAAVAAHRSQLPGGVPEALFPPGIVAALLEAEWFTDARGRQSEDVPRLLPWLTAVPGGGALPG